MRHKLYFLNILFLFLFTIGTRNSNAQVTVYSSDSLSCTVLCTTLNAVVEGDSPTDAGITSDDVYSILHGIGFTFNYYGTNYTQVVIGANGTLDFNVADATAGDPWPITAPLLGNPSKYNNICGPWCDIDIFYTGTPVGSETYSTDGVAPFRKFAVTWCGCSMYSCGTQHTTTQIILYETTNIIEVHIAQKPVCTSWNPSSPPGAGGMAIVGVQNATGTAATTAPGRDFPSIWSIPPSEAWRFTPAGGGTSYTVASIPYAPIPLASSAVYWYNATTGAYLGTGTSLVVCPATRTTYKAGALGCADTSFGYYTVTPSGSLSITTTSTNPTLCGACDGTITIHGLTPGLSDTINYMLGGVAQPRVVAIVPVGGTITLTGLCSGNYTNIIARQGLCSSLPAAVTLADPPISISSVSTVNPSLCSVADGQLVLHGLYASHSFTVNYNFNGVAQPPVSSTSSVTGTITLTGLCAGVYDNIIASYGACITPPVGPYTLNNPPISISSVAHINPSACGVCDGTITLSGLYPGHSFNIAYNYNGVAQTPLVMTTSSTGTIILTGLCTDPLTGMGVYSNIVASFTGPCPAPACTTAPVAVTLIAPAPPVFNLTASTNPSQCGYCDGTITISGVPPLTLDTIFYSINGVPHVYVVESLPDGTLHMIGLCAGAYTAFTVKVGPCTSNVIGTATLGAPPIVPGFSDAIHYGCNGDTVFFTNSSTSPGILYYRWDFGDGHSDTATNPYHIYAQGVYTVTMIATNFRCDSSAKLTVTLLHPLHAAFRLTPDLICQGSQVSFTNKTDSLSSPPLAYQWFFGDGNTGNSINPNHIYLFTGTYTVKLVASNFIPCFDTASAIVQADSISPVYIGLTDSVLCRSTSVTFDGTYTTIGNTGVTWHFGDGDSTLNINPVTHSYDGTGTFIVTATAHYRICSDISTSRTVNLFNAPNVYIGQDTTICPGGEAIILSDRNSVVNLAAKYKWSTGQTTPTIAVSTPGTYSVDVNIDGCHSTDSIHVLSDCYMNVPNVFTPNGDGSNDYFYPRKYLTKGLVAFKMDIYNRWGQLIFQTTAIDGSGWDGKLNNVDQPVGVYIYNIDATFKDGQKEHHQGNVTLLR